MPFVPSVDTIRGVVEFPIMVPTRFTFLETIEPVAVCSICPSE